MERRVPLGARPVGHHRPRADQSNRRQRRALQPEPRRSVHVERASGPCATSTAATARWSGNKMVRGDWPLKPGDIIRIGHTQLVFVHKLSEAFSRRATPARRPAGAGGRWLATRGDAADDESSVLAVSEPTTITHRRGHTKFLAPGEEEEGGVSKMGRAAAKLCRLAFELAKSARRGHHGRRWRWPAWPRQRKPTPGRCCCCRPNVQGTPRGERAGDHRLAQFDATPLPSRLRLPGFHGDARRRGRVGPQRDGRQHAGHAATARARSSPPA